MTEQLHPMVPPNILLNNWESDWFDKHQNVDVLLIQAYQAGADRQLEADAKWLDQNSLDAPHLTITPTGKSLVEAMRPKPPSLKQRALQELDKVDMLWATEEFGQETLNSLDTIRRAIKSIPND